MHVTLTSPTVGLTAVYPCTTPTGPHDARWRRYRQGVKSAPAHARGRKLYPDRKSRDQPIRERFPQHRPNVPAATRISLDDVVNMAEHAREATSLQSRRLVMEEAQRALRYENAMMERSRPHSVIGPGLQAFTSPMPSPSRGGQVDHIPSLLPLPSDRTFIPSPDHNHDRHVTTTPTDHFRLEDDNTHHPVARQCCEIMGPSLCRSCRRLESRAQNRKSAELECPRMRSAGGRGRQTFSLTQVIKRSYPRLSDAEIQDKLARGEIARLSFPWNSRNDRYDEDDIDDDNNITNINYLSSGRSSTADKGQDSYDDDDDDDDNIDDEEDKDILHVDPGTYRANSNTPSTRPDSGTVNCGSEGNISNKADNTNNSVRSTSSTRQHLTKASLDSKNAFYFLARLTMKLRGATSTPLFFSDLRSMQSKILSGTVDRKAYMTLRPDMERSRQTQQGQPSRLKSAVSSTSTSSGKSGLSKFGSQLSREFMPAFVSPRKIKLLEEPKYKVFFEPPLLTKRRQIPNPSFFAGSNDEYSLPERLPDVIEFADSQRIAALEKQIRSGSALSFVSSMSDEQQQQLLQSSLGEQDKLTSLPLDKGDDSGMPDGAVGENRPASAKGGVREGGVSTPTPRSLLRVSSGGPLSSRTVPEENEEEVRRELEADRQVEQEEPMRKDEDKLDTNKSKENLYREENIENTLNAANENVSNSDSNVENRETFENKTIAEKREEEETIMKESGEVKDVLEEEIIPDQGSLSLNHEVSQKEIESSSRIFEESDPAVDEVSVQHQPSKELESDYTCIKENIQEVDKSGDAILEESGSHGTQCSPFFLTNREQSGQLGSLKDSGRETSAEGNNSDNNDDHMYNGPGNIANSDNVTEDEDDNDDETRDDDDNGHIIYADRESP